MCRAYVLESWEENELDMISASISGMIKKASETHQIGFQDDVKLINFLNFPNTDETD